MRSDPTAYIKYILESIMLIQEYTRQVSKQEFLARTYLQDAVIRRREVIEREKAFLLGGGRFIFPLPEIEMV